MKRREYMFEAQCLMWHSILVTLFIENLSIEPFAADVWIPWIIRKSTSTLKCMEKHRGKATSATPRIMKISCNNKGYFGKKIFALYPAAPKIKSVKQLEGLRISGWSKNNKLESKITRETVTSLPLAAEIERKVARKLQNRFRERFFCTARSRDEQGKEFNFGLIKINGICVLLV